MDQPMTDDSKPRTLKEQLETQIADAERSAAKDPKLYNGWDWSELSDEEQVVFDIDRKRFPRMMLTFSCYEAFKRIVREGFFDDDLIEQARQQHPEWSDEAISELEFSDFAKEYGGLTFRESAAFYNKNKFWGVRTGITYYRDELQDD
jgi:hypothetical protein